MAAPAPDRRLRNPPAVLVRRIPATDTLAAMDRLPARHLRRGTLARARLVPRPHLALGGAAGARGRRGPTRDGVLPDARRRRIRPATSAVGEFARILHLDAPRSRTLCLRGAGPHDGRPAPRGALGRAARPGPRLAGTIAGGVREWSPRPRAAARARAERPSRWRAAGWPFAAGPIARWRAVSTDTPASRAFAAGLGRAVPSIYAFNFAAAFLLLRDLAPEASPRLVLSFLRHPAAGQPADRVQRPRIARAHQAPP